MYNIGLYCERLLNAFFIKLGYISKSYIDSKYLRELKKKAISDGEEYQLKQKGFIFETSSLRPRFYLPYYESEYIQQKILANRGYYEESELKYITSIVEDGIIGDSIKGRCVLDIGSNIGNHTLYFILECGASIVHCFEPMAKVISVLKKNLEINEVQNKVVLHQVGVGAQTSKACMRHFDRENMGSTELDYNDAGDISIVSIDDLCFSEDVVMIKIDVEGFEYEVIKGMKETLKKFRPYIMIEIRNIYFNPINDILKSIGYWYIKIGVGINYLFIPSKLQNKNNENK